MPTKQVHTKNEPESAAIVLYRLLGSVMVVLADNSAYKGPHRDKSCAELEHFEKYQRSGKIGPMDRENSGKMLREWPSSFVSGTVETISSILSKIWLFYHPGEAKRGRNFVNILKTQPAGSLGWLKWFIKSKESTRTVEHAAVEDRLLLPRNGHPLERLRMIQAHF